MKMLGIGFPVFIAARYIAVSLAAASYDKSQPTRRWVAAVAETYRAAKLPGASFVTPLTFHTHDRQLVTAARMRTRCLSRLIP